jgi:methylglutaconyl-CoA hydratase
MYETIEVEVVGGVAAVALNRPAVRNAFNAQMIAELTDAFNTLAAHADVRAIVLSGHGKTFSAGADVNWMRSSLELTPDQNVADAERLSDMFATIDSVPQPLVGRVHGAALGGGMGLIACCDVVVAAEGTTFGFTEAKLGIIPAVISRFVLPKVGTSWARALYLTAERFDTDVARHILLVHWVVPEAELNDTVAHKVQEILSSGPGAVKEAKTLVATARGLTPEEMRSLTARRIAKLRASPEGQEGLRSFVEKRQPSWTRGSVPAPDPEAGQEGGRSSATAHSKEQ